MTFSSPIYSFTQILVSIQVFRLRKLDNHLCLMIKLPVFTSWIIIVWNVVTEIRSIASIIWKWYMNVSSFFSHIMNVDIFPVIHWDISTWKLLWKVSIRIFRYVYRYSFSQTTTVCKWKIWSDFSVLKFLELNQKNFGNTSNLNVENY